MSVAFGAHSYAWMWSMPARPCLERLQALGFDEFELITMPGHLWPTEMSGAQRVSLRDWVEGEGATLRTLNHPGTDLNLASPVPEVRAYSVQILAQVLALAADLRCPAVVVVTGRVNPLLPAPLEHHRQWVLDALRALVPVAEDLGVRLALENIPLGPLPRARDLLDAVAWLNSPAVAVCWDAANAHFCGEDPAEGLREVAPWLEVVHLSDTDRSSWRHDVIGTGAVDFASVLQAARDVGHARKPLLELCIRNPEEGHRASLSRLAALETTERLQRE
ncbi:sugar phosphate isomerase/epimerase family protein [Hydrogenophaga sp. BPS33]|uniref:sugar phosphate isomerase/epimerase family protein n=1 Tax=Hydrogenophaga sp. BPS33 TaxID=2651974 RepID=UPI00132004BB|nr:sugar phosphate isomerase/epimerase family protein [Hydrogenophaga sp. BPS33]QHE84310.1 sugar phosphate isomerase/epimerase [Hydrogenophaga sp. BPS33]